MHQSFCKLGVVFVKYQVDNELLDLLDSDLPKDTYLRHQ